MLSGLRAARGPVQRTVSVWERLARTSPVCQRLYPSQTSRPDFVRHVVTGYAKAELVAKQMSNDNPFDNYVMKPDAGVGSFQNTPILIPSVNESRLVGCCCEDDYQEIVWFKLHKGEVQKCDCGNYFKLIDYDPLDPNVKPRFGAGFGSGLGSMYY